MAEALPCKHAIMSGYHIWKGHVDLVDITGTTTVVPYHLVTAPHSMLMYEIHVLNAVIHDTCKLFPNCGETIMFKTTHQKYV